MRVSVRVWCVRFTGITATIQRLCRERSNCQITKDIDKYIVGVTFDELDDVKIRHHRDSVYGDACQNVDIMA